jgi:hypothetical protein
MLVGFVEDEMIFKTTLLIYALMAISNTLVSRIKHHKEEI